MRRLTAPLSRLAGVRFYTPPEDLKKVFQGDFDKQKFPVDLAPTDSNLFAKFLFKACEPKGNYDAVLADFKTIAAASAKLPVFWERDAVIEKVPEFKGVSPPMLFTLTWMEKQRMLDHLPAVRQAFETYTNAVKKKVVAVIYVPDKGGDAAANEAKSIAQKMHSENAELKGTSLDFNIIVDKQILSGYAVDVAGRYYSAAKGVETGSSTTIDVDYTSIPAPKFRPTQWDDSIETEYLRKYLDQLALYDKEEFQNGV